MVNRPVDDEGLGAILAAASALGIGVKRCKYEGDIADLVAEGRADFAPAVAITLYFEGPRERFADGIAACWAEFLEGFGERLTWYACRHCEVVFRPPSACMCWAAEG